MRARQLLAQHAEFKPALLRYLPAILLQSETGRSARKSWNFAAAWVVPAWAVAARSGP